MEGGDLFLFLCFGAVVLREDFSYRCLSQNSLLFPSVLYLACNRVTSLDLARGVPVHR